MGEHLTALVGYLAAWEDREGTMAAMMPHEHAAFMDGLKTLAIRHSPREARNELRALSAEQPAKDAVAWLIEMPTARWGTGFYWGGMGVWTQIDHAVRFSRKVDAEAVLAALKADDRKYSRQIEYEACEHEWLPADPRPSETGPCSCWGMAAPCHYIDGAPACGRPSERRVGQRRESVVAEGIESREVFYRTGADRRKPTERKLEVGKPCPDCGHVIQYPLSHMCKPTERARCDAISPVLGWCGLPAGHDGLHRYCKQQELTPLSPEAKAARMPLPPEVLVDARHDNLQINTERIRPAVSARPQEDDLHLLSGLREALLWKPNTPQLENAMTYAWEQALRSYVRAIEAAAPQETAPKSRFPGSKEFWDANTNIPAGPDTHPVAPQAPREAQAEVEAFLDGLDDQLEAGTLSNRDAYVLTAQRLNKLVRDPSRPVPEGWVSVSERLPEAVYAGSPPIQSERVLIAYMENTSCGPYQGVGEYWYDATGWDSADIGDYSTVTHWRPLPASPATTEPREPRKEKP